MSSTLLRSTRPAAGHRRAIALPRDPADVWGDMIERLPADDAVLLVDELNDASRLLILADRVVVAAGASGRAAADVLARRLRRLGMSVRRADSSDETTIEATDTVVVIAEADDAAPLPDLEVDLTVRPVVIVITSASRPCSVTAWADGGLRLPEFGPTAEGDLWAARQVAFMTRSTACAEAVSRNIEARLSLTDLRGERPFSFGRAAKTSELALL